MYSLIKRLIRPIFKRYANFLYRELQLDVQANKLEWIIEHNKKTQDKIDKILKQLQKLHILLGGIDSEWINRIINPAELTADITDILAYNPTDVYAANFINAIDESILENRSVCLIGSNNNLFIDLLLKKNIKNLTVIELNPYVIRDSKSENNSVNLQAYYVYPTKIPTLHLQQFDVLVSPSAAANRFLLKFDFFHIGSYVSEAGIFMLEGTEKEHRYFLTRLHTSGFSEILSENKKHSFDYKEIQQRDEFLKEESNVTRSDLYFTRKLPNISKK